MVTRPTKGTIEADIANAVTRFQREQQGRGADQVRAHLLGDLVVVRSTGIFTHIEARLAISEEGRRLVRSARHELRAINHLEVEHIVSAIVGCPVLRSYADIDAEAAEQIEVYVLAADVERGMARAIAGRAAGPERGAEPERRAAR